MFSESVEMHFSRGSQQRVLAEDHNAFPALSGQALKSNAEVDFLSGKEFFAEAADFAKSGGFAEDE